MTETPTDAPAPELAPANDPVPESAQIETTEAPEAYSDDSDQSAAPPEGDDAEQIEDSRSALEKEFKAAYTRKTQEIAEIRKSLEQRQAKLDDTVQRGEALVNVLAAEFQAEFQNVDWGKLAADDPADYVKKRHAFDERQRKLALAMGQLQASRQQQQAMEAETVQQRIAEEQQRLVEKLPDWKDAKKAQAEAAALRDYLTESGYGEDEVNGVTDHRAVILARKAMLYDQMMAKAPKASPVSKAPPPVSKAPTRTSGPKDWTQMTDKEFAEWRRRQVAQRR